MGRRRVRPWPLLSILLLPTACSTEPTFDSGSAGTTEATASSSSVSSSTTASDTTSPASTGSGTGGDPTGGTGGDGGSAPDGSTASSSADGSGGGGGPPSGCGDGVVAPGETCDLGPDLVSELCVDCQVVCPQGWELAPSGTRCFRRDDGNGTKNMFDAASACAATRIAGVRARLATPRMQEDLEAVLDLCDGGLCFLGATDLEVEGSFYWVDGQPLDAQSGDIAWTAGQPDDFNSRQDCVGVLDEILGARLQDAPCDANSEYVCEILPGWAEDSRCEVNDQLDPGEECQGGVYCIGCDRACNTDLDNDAVWIEAPITTHTCYLSDAAPSDNGTAVHLCGEFDARLATPDDVADLAVARYVCGTGNCWLGASDPVTDGVWTWNGSGEPFDYVNGQPPWAPGEPASGIPAQCVVTNEAQLDDYVCSATDPRPLCERAD